MNNAEKKTKIKNWGGHFLMSLGVSLLVHVRVSSIKQQNVMLYIKLVRDRTIPIFTEL